MPEFHRTKPSKIFSGKNMDIFIESDYPTECFGAPKYYVAYLTIDGDIRALEANDTEQELLIQLHRWKENGFLYRLIKDDIERYREQVA